MIVYMIVYIERLYVMASSAVNFYLQSILTAGVPPPNGGNYVIF